EAVNKASEIRIGERAFVVVVPVKFEQVLVEPEGLQNGRIAIGVAASRWQIRFACRQDAGSTLQVPRHESLGAVEDRSIRRKLEGVLRLRRRLFAARVKRERLLRDEIVEGGTIRVGQCSFLQELIERGDRRLL